MGAEQIPDNAEEAKAQGWHMVCVLPCRTVPDNLIALITVHFEHTASGTLFTYKGRRIEAQTQAALWVKNFKWSTEGRDVLLRTLFSKNPALHRFVREVLRQYMPPEALAKRKKHRIQKNRQPPDPLVGRTFHNA
jgi:hypothetical protein